MRSRWQIFVTGLIQDAKFWLFAVLYLQIFRILFFFYFANRISEAADWSDFAVAILQGFRFDGQTAAHFVLIPFTLNLLLSPFVSEQVIQAIRRTFGYLFIVITTVLFIVTIGYFKEFDDQFDHFLFEALYYDRGDIMQTILQDPSFHFWPSMIVMAMFIIGLIFIFRRWVRPGENRLIRWMVQFQHTWQRTLIVVLSLVLVVGALRGSYAKRPVLRKWVGTTKDQLINKAIVNPHTALRDAYKNFRRIQSDEDALKLFLPDEDVRKAAQSYFQTDLDSDQLEDYLRQFAPGTDHPPDNIFLLILESVDAWIFLPEYASLGLTEPLKPVLKNGTHYVHFLPAANNTMNSYGAMISGIPHTGVKLSFIGAQQEPFLTSLPQTFKRAGYRTRFFYGGIMSQHNIGNFSSAQGVDELYAQPHMLEGASTNAWGVNDEYLFKYVLNHVNEGDKALNIILNCTYHPPFVLDVDQGGFPLADIPADVHFDGSIDRMTLGHLWYSIQWAAYFMQEMAKKCPNSLFVITGDHYSRRFVHGQPTFYEKSAVPLILYGPDIVPADSTVTLTPGSHLDILPTLMDLCAPAGFEYYSFGRSLWPPDSTKAWPGIARDKVITPHFLVDATKDGEIHPSPYTPLPTSSIDPTLYVQQHDQLLGLGWWLVMRGTSLQSDD